MKEYLKYKIPVLVIGLSMWPILLVWGQFRFINYDYTNGLPITQINHFAEDSLGNIWMGSTNGLVVFDGLEFNYFEPGLDNQASIIGSEIAKITVDKLGDVWVSFHDGGLSKFNYKSQSFISRSYQDSDGIQFPRYSIVDMLIDEKREKVWLISTREGVFEMNMKTLECSLVGNFSGPKSIVQDPSDSSYFYLSAEGLFKVNKDDYQSQEVSTEIFNKLKTRDGLIYGHDWSDNALIFNPEDGTTHKFVHSTDNINRDVLMVGKNIWLSHYNDVEIYNTDNKKSDRLSNSWNPDRPPNGKHFYGLFQDNSDRIWMGTDEGVSVIIPEYQNLVDLKSLGDLRAFNMIEGFEEDTYYAASLYDDRIVKFNFTTGKTQDIIYSKGMDFLGPVEMVRQDEKIWVIGFRGVGFFTKNDPYLRPYKAFRYEDVFRQRDLGNIIVDGEKNIWIGRNKASFLTKIPHDGSQEDTVMIQGLKGDNELKVMCFHNDAIWLGTNEGIGRINLNNFRESWYDFTGSQHEVLNSSIEDIGVDVAGNIWFLSLQSGAFKCSFDTNSGELRVIKGYYQKDGLSNNRPWDIDTDSHGLVYFGSTSGLSIYHPSIDRMIPYGKEYGFYDLSTRVKCIGDKLFVMSNGVQYLNRESYFHLKDAPQVQIESIYNDGKNIPLPSNGDLLSFSHDQNNLSAEYKVIEFNHPRDIRYRYRMIKDERWRYADFNERRALFSRLAPGEYRFEVAAAGKDMRWGPVADFQFTINPPYWKTWWFFILMIFSIVSLVFFIVRWRERQIKVIGDMKARMSELENEALRAQMNPHFIFNSLNSIKSFIITNRKEEAADYLTTFAELIRIILRNSKSQLIPLSEEIKALNLYMEIENIRLNDKFSVNWVIEPGVAIESLLVPPLAIQPFVENAIWHGFVHKEGKGQLSIRIDRNDSQLLIDIIDDGIGREKSRLIEENHFRKRSYGISITEQRLGLKEEKNITIFDLKSHDGSPQGTKVSLKVPIKLLNP